MYIYVLAILKTKDTYAFSGAASGTTSRLSAITFLLSLQRHHMIFFFANQKLKKIKNLKKKTEKFYEHK